MSLEPTGFLYQKEGAKPVMRPTASSYHKSRGYTETPMYAGPDVAVIAAELRRGRAREADLGVLLGQLCIALIHNRGVTIKTPATEAPATEAPAQP